MGGCFAHGECDVAARDLRRSISTQKECCVGPDAQKKTQPPLSTPVLAE